MFLSFLLKYGNSYYLNITLFLGAWAEPGAGAGFEICLEPEPENQKRTGSGNAGCNTRCKIKKPDLKIVSAVTQNF